MYTYYIAKITHYICNVNIIILERTLSWMYEMHGRIVEYTSGNKGQGSSLLLCVLSLRLFICQTLEIVILISLLMMTKK